MKLKKYCAITIVGVVMMVTAVVFATKMRDDFEKQFSVIEDKYVENGTVDVQDENSNKPIFDAETGKFFLPLRDIVDEMGGSVEWNQEKSVVVIDLRGATAEIKEGDNKGSINGYSIYLGDAPRNINGCLYVSSDFIVNNFGAIVEWDEENKVITIKTEVEKSPIVDKNRFVYEDKDMAYSIEVPVITGLNDKKYEESLNNSIVSKVMEDIKIFATQSRLDENDENIYHWNETVDVKYESSKLISLVVNGIKEEPDGISNTIMTAVNINLETQSIMKLEDFFKNDKYKEEVLERINNMWTVSPENYPISVSEDIEFVMEQNFYVSDNNLVIFIKNKDGKTYSEFKIPFYDLRKYIKSDMTYIAKNTSELVNNN